MNPFLCSEEPFYFIDYPRDKSANGSCPSACTRCPPHTATRCFPATARTSRWRRPRCRSGRWLGRTSILRGRGRMRRGSTATSYMWTKVSIPLRLRLLVLLTVNTPVHAPCFPQPCNLIICIVYILLCFPRERSGRGSDPTGGRVPGEGDAGGGSRRGQPAHAHIPLQTALVAGDRSRHWQEAD